MEGKCGGEDDGKGLQLYVQRNTNPKTSYRIISSEAIITEKDLSKGIPVTRAMAKHADLMDGTFADGTGLLIGTILGGSGATCDNVIAMNAEVIDGAYKSWETELMHDLTTTYSGGLMKVKITLDYDGNQFEIMLSFIIAYQLTALYPIRSMVL